MINIVDIKALSDSEARKYLEQNPIPEILKNYSSSDIQLLVEKSNKINNTTLTGNEKRSIEIPKPIENTTNIHKNEVVFHENIPESVKKNPPPLPSIMTQAKNFKNAMVDWAKGGFGTVSQNTFKGRIDICKQCEFWQSFGDTVGRCRKCGCSSVKMALSTSRCPLNPPKWGSVPNGT
jgi:hypothetical protein